MKPPVVTLAVEACSGLPAPRVVVIGRDRREAVAGHVGVELGHSVDALDGGSADEDLHLALAAALGDVHEHGDLVVLTQTQEVLAKVPEPMVDSYLGLRPDRGRVLATVGPQSWVARGGLAGSDATRVAALPRSFQGPRLSVRELSDVVCGPWSAVIQENVVLPETYRDRRPRLRSQAVADWDQWFDQAPAWEPRRLAGRYYHLDNEWRGHFGHALTEPASKAWGWPEAKRLMPDLRALVVQRPAGPGFAQWEADLWSAAGFEPQHLLVADEPVRVETLVTASPAYSNPHDHHPRFLETLDRVGAVLGGRASPRAWPTRVFLSRRRSHKRYCHNTDEVEDLMRAHGFVVVHPQDHDIADQVGFVRNAQVIAGFIGSGMYQIGYAGEPKHVIALLGEGYTGLGEVRLSALVGHRLDLVWCRPDVEPTSGYSREAFNSDFTYDPAREGRYLTDVLGRL